MRRALDVLSRPIFRDGNTDKSHEAFHDVRRQKLTAAWLFRHSHPGLLSINRQSLESIYWCTPLIQSIHLSSPQFISSCAHLKNVPPNQLPTKGPYSRYSRSSRMVYHRLRCSYKIAATLSKLQLIWFSF